MVAFTSARRAVACAVDIQRAIASRNRREPERAIRVRIGLNTSEVIREEEDLFGVTVKAAKWITDHAPPRSPSERLDEFRRLTDEWEKGLAAMAREAPPSTRRG